MFQTEINHFFQSFANDWLTGFMQFVSALGYVEFFMAFLFILMFTINFKKGIILLLILLWTALITFIGKAYFDLPRPFHVDNTLLMLDGQLPDEAEFSLVERGAAKFLDPLPVDVLQITRQSEGVENGFPSGHSSVAIAFWGALMILYPRKLMWVVSTSFMILIPLSRIYLGVHFLADVLGGVVLGGIMLWIFYRAILKPSSLLPFIDRHHFSIGWNMHSLALIFAPLPFPLLFFFDSRGAIIVVILLGVGLGYLMLSKNGIPSDEGVWIKRIGRLLLSIGAAVSIGLGVRFLLGLAGFADHPIGEALILFTFFLVLIWAGTEISIRIGLFKRNASSV